MENYDEQNAKLQLDISKIMSATFRPKNFLDIGLSLSIYSVGHISHSWVPID